MRRDTQEHLDPTDPPAVPELDEQLLRAAKYRFLARRPPWEHPSRHWQIAPLGQWREYTLDELRALAGDYPFNLWFQEVLADEFIVAQAWRDEQWVSASWWLEDANYIFELAERARAQSRVPEIVQHIKRIRRESKGRRPGLGEVAHHLVDHAGYSRDKAIELARQGGCEVFPEQWGQDVTNGRKREQSGKVCRLCVEN